MIICRFIHCHDYFEKNKNNRCQCTCIIISMYQCIMIVLKKSYDDHKVLLCVLCHTYKCMPETLIAINFEIITSLFCEFILNSNFKCLTVMFSFTKQICIRPQKFLDSVKLTLISKSFYNKSTSIMEVLNMNSHD